MRILIAAVGRMRAGPERVLYDHYRKRITWPVTVHEVEDRRAPAGKRRRQREGDLLLATLDPSTTIVVLDESGEQLDSVAFADRLRRWRDAGQRDFAFVVGGADGVDRRLRDRADLVLSLGRMTWPHLLVRALLLEQIYRAQQILAGHPYHRE
jgi:23S rRNA (pseudouridine1915-N3)-methyltransferase